WGAVRRVAARRLAAELPVDLGRGFRGCHPRRQELERPVAHRARVKGSLPPPAQVAVQDVWWGEAAAVEKALGQAQGTADRPADLVPSSQPDQHTPTPIFSRGRVAHGPFTFAAQMNSPDEATLHAGESSGEAGPALRRVSDPAEGRKLPGPG